MCIFEVSGLGRDISIMSKDLRRVSKQLLRSGCSSKGMANDGVQRVHETQILFVRRSYANGVGQSSLKSYVHCLVVEGNAPCSKTRLQKYINEIVAPISCSERRLIFNFLVHI